MPTLPPRGLCFLGGQNLSDGRDDDLWLLQLNVMATPDRADKFPRDPAAPNFCCDSTHESDSLADFARVDDQGGDVEALVLD